MNNSNSEILQTQGLGLNGTHEKRIGIWRREGVALAAGRREHPGGTKSISGGLSGTPGSSRRVPIRKVGRIPRVAENRIRFKPARTRQTLSRRGSEARRVSRPGDRSSGSEEIE